MITRAIEDRINNALAKKKAVTIMGPRQVGKSTLADAIIPKDVKVLEINGDNTDVQTMFENVDEAKMKIRTALLLENPAEERSGSD
ncbi:MAG: AAA family ATPase [Bacteroidales bacterium]|nr:AAA family ATPase [Bacteroidales bacterium]